MTLPEEKEYDVVIIGSGFGGLACGYILASEGNSVAILEKNNQLGGNLQVFSRDKSIFDTGVHYIGSLDEGENLHSFFKYFGLLDNIKLKRLNDEYYDIIRFSDGKEYKHGHGYPNFIKYLVEAFPEEETGIRTFCDRVQEICRQFPLYNLETIVNASYTDTSLRSENAHDYIASLTNNERLRNVLAGNNPLYAGDKEKTPLYVHALILNSYITGSYRLVDGGSQLATHMSKSIKKFGGDLFRRKNVVGANFLENGHIKELILESGEKVRGKKFISNIHPAVTIQIMGEKRFLGAYRKRISNLENTISSFTLHLSFHKKTFPYINHNVYHYEIEDVWQGIHPDRKTWPEGIFISTPPNSKNEEFADSMSVMTYMTIDEVAQWKDSFNTVASPESRGPSYEDFKKLKEEKVLAVVEKLYPDIRSKIKNQYSSTPLTFRDYIGNYDGSLYGIVKDHKNPEKSHISARTRIPNLYLTGQNLIFHGILGVTIGAFVTCFEFLDRHKLIEKVKNA